MGQAINDIRHMLDLAKTLRADARKTKQTQYSQKLLEAAAELDAQVERLCRQKGISLS